MKTTKKKAPRPHRVDIHVGSRIRHFRRLRDMTQGDLAKKIKVRFQQVQKYETAINRVSASRLSMIAKTLDVEIWELFEDG